MRKSDRRLISEALILGVLNIGYAIYIWRPFSIVNFSIGVVCLYGAIGLWRKVK